MAVFILLLRVKSSRPNVTSRYTVLLAIKKKAHPLNHNNKSNYNEEERERESNISVLEKNIVFSPQTIERSSGLISHGIVNSRAS